MSVPIDTKEIIDPSLITTPPATPVESGSLSGREVKQQEKIQETIESVRKSLEIVKEKELSSQETFTINLYKELPDIKYFKAKDGSLYPEKVPDNPNTLDGFKDGKTALERHVEFFSKDGQVSFNTMIKNLAKIKDPFTAFYESIIREIGLKSIAEKKCPFKISNQRISDQGKHPVSTGIFASNSNINRAALEQLKLFDKNGKGGLYLEEVKDIVERNYLAEKEKNLFADKKDKLSSFDLSWNKYNNKVWEWIPLFILSVLSQENKTNEKKFVKFSEIEEFFYEPENTWAKFEAMYNKTKPCVTAACYGGE